ncbi:MAG: hypothetical protein CMA10_07045 [Euryarchaeota archaeon]|nr:hypothetical protein [Euryarchaeota archaeon]
MEAKSILSAVAKPAAGRRWRWGPSPRILSAVAKPAAGRRWRWRLRGLGPWYESQNFLTHTEWALLPPWQPLPAAEEGKMAEPTAAPAPAAGEPTRTSAAHCDVDLNRTADLVASALAADGGKMAEPAEAQAPAPAVCNVPEVHTPGPPAVQRESDRFTPMLRRLQTPEPRGNGKSLVSLDFGSDGGDNAGGVLALQVEVEANDGATAQAGCGAKHC